MTSDITSGLQTLRRFVADGSQGEMWRTFSQKLADAGDGWAVMEALPEKRFNNLQQRIHGGFVATLIDSAMGCAVMTKLAADTGYGTIELKVNFVRKVDVATGLLMARATVLHAGRTMLTAECKVVDAAGVLYAHGSGTFLVYPK